MSVRLSSELNALGCTVPPDLFGDLLDEVHGVMHPSWSVDELVCHPAAATLFCNVIRSRTACQNLPDDLILRTLMNRRRRGRTD